MSQNDDRDVVEKALPCVGSYGFDVAWADETDVEKAPYPKDVDWVVVNFSGGKDSTAALVWTVKRFDKRKIHVFNVDTGCEYKGMPTYVHNMAKKFGVKLFCSKADMTFLEYVMQHPSGKTWNMESMHCWYNGIKLNRMKKDRKKLLESFGSTNGLIIEGSRAEESPDRAERGASGEFKELPGVKVYRPVFSMKQEDVWNYLRKNGIEPFWAYVEGAPRFGCFCCPYTSLANIALVHNKMPNEFAKWKAIEKRRGGMMLHGVKGGSRSTLSSAQEAGQKKLEASKEKMQVMIFGKAAVNSKKSVAERLSTYELDELYLMEERLFEMKRNDLEDFESGDYDEVSAAIVETIGKRVVSSIDKAVWTTSYMNDLPDSAFLYIESGGEKDAEGKTTPRRLRHWPVRNHLGELDIEHIRNAIARIPQTKVPLSTAELKAYQDKARALLEEAKVGKTAEYVIGKSVDRVTLIKLKEERYVLGVVLEPNDGKGEADYDPDSQKDIYSESEVRQTEQKFMEDFQNIGLMHRTLVNGKVKILESYITPIEFLVAPDGTTCHESELKKDDNPLKNVSRDKFQTVRKGTWLLGLRVADDELWQKVKRGELGGLSIGGSARRVAA